MGSMAPKSNESVNQSPSYQSDLDRGHRTPVTRDSGVDGLHTENLFDEDERQDGGMYDEGTGRPYDNSSMRDETYLTNVGSGRIADPHLEVPESARTSDVLGDLPEETDEAAQWLAQHDKDAQDTRNESQDYPLDNVA